MPRKTNQKFVVFKDFNPADAWDAEFKYYLVRKFGSQAEADKRESDPLTKAMIDWAVANPRPNPLTYKGKKR